MSLMTTIFNLFKLQKTDPYDITQFNANMDIIDEEMAKPPLTVNGIEPDPVTRDLEVTTVPLADNLTTEEAQINTGTYVIRTSGGEASIADGGAWLSDVKGNMIKTGYVPESLQMTVTLADPAAEDSISASIDRDTFVEEVTSSTTITLTYSTAWSSDPATYGITVTGTPAAGDQIVVVYVKENRGTITTATPTSFVSTGWNLYNHAAGYARVVDYSEEYGFMIAGTYTGLKFAATLDGEQTVITPTDGYFTVPSDGYVFVTGGNSTDTEIWMTWSDWTEEANGGVFAAYTSESIDMSGVMVDFPAGLMKIGNYYDEINLNTGKAYSRIERMEYTDENLAAVIASGVPYDTDTDYIYAVRVEPVVYTISLDGEYTVSDHGMEMFLGTSVPLTASSLYGNDLKGKLRRDVVTISQQTLTSNQQAQVRTNIGAFSQADGDALNSKIPTSNAYDEILITAGSDINNYKTAGTFIVPNDSTASQISNMPLSASGRLIVMNRTTSSYMVQEYYPTTVVPIKYVRNYNNGTWTNWEQIANMTETGTWTPQLGRDTATGASGAWVRIGTLLFITAQWTNSHNSGQGNSYIDMVSVPAPSGYSRIYGFHGTWRSNTTDVGGECGQYSNISSLWFSKGGVPVQLPNEPISFNAICLLQRT